MDDTHDSQGNTVQTAGISSVRIKVVNLSNSAVTNTISGTLSSGQATNGTYSVTIPKNSTTFPAKYRTVVSIKLTFTLLLDDNGDNGYAAAPNPF